MTRPHLALSMPFDARFTTRYDPTRLVSTTSVNSASVIRTSRVSRVMPALATSTSTGPSFSSISVKAASIDSASVTSARTVRDPSGPWPLRAVTATRWPWATNSSAIA